MSKLPTRVNLEPRSGLASDNLSIPGLIIEGGKDKYIVDYKATR